ncbi:zinc finger, CCHC-type containing protein, partial [Tanacetum coccineum]
MSANQTTNNNSIRSILDKEKLNGINFLDWYRNLRIVLKNEQKSHHLEEALPKAPPATATVVVRNAYTLRVAEQQEVFCLMLVSMTPEIQKNLEDRTAFEILQELKTMFQQQAEQELFKIVKAFHACKQEEGQSVSTCVLKMKAYLDQMERLGYPMPLVLGVNLILTSLSKTMTKKSIPKKAPAVLAIRQGALDLYVGNGNRVAVEAIRSFDLTLPSGMVLVLDNCHFSPSITRWVISLSSLWDNCFLHKFMDNGAISVSKDNLFYFNVIPRDGIFEIDMHDHVSNERFIYTCSNKKSKHNLDSTFLWHCRLGHINKKRITKLQHDGLLESTDDESFDVCVFCISGKMERKPFTHGSERTDDLLGLIYSD